VFEENSNWMAIDLAILLRRWNMTNSMLGVELATAKTSTL